MAYGYIYKITNLINGKVYIGQAIDVIKRWKRHIAYSKTATKGIDAAIRKYGAGCFSVITVQECYDRKNLDDAEKYFIALYRNIYTRKGCYNITDGGEGFHSKHTEATKQKQSNSKKGEKNPMYSKPSPNRRIVYQYDKQGNFVRAWNYVREAEAELGVSHSSISKCCSGKRQSVGGFIFRYKEEETI